MGYFPLCLDLQGKRILVVGHGPETDVKLEKLCPFGAEILRLGDLTEADLSEDVAFVVAGDLERAEAERISGLCRARRVPVNVVDESALCSFFFPALTTRGDLTVSVSTGGKSPGAAAYLNRQISQLLPAQSDEILDWLYDLRQQLYEVYPKDQARIILHQAAQQAFDSGHFLRNDEMLDIARKI